MIRALALAVLALDVLVLAAGCGARPEAAASGGVATELTVFPKSPAALRPATLRLRFTDDRGRAVTPDVLEAEVQMAGMVHGAERLAFRSVGEGRYEAAHVFSMDGTWEIQVRATIGANTYATRRSLGVGSE